MNAQALDRIRDTLAVIGPMISVEPDRDGFRISTGHRLPDGTDLSVELRDGVVSDCGEIMGWLFVQGLAVSTRRVRDWLDQVQHAAALRFDGRAFFAEAGADPGFAAWCLADTCSRIVDAAWLSVDATDDADILDAAEESFGAEVETELRLALPQTEIEWSASVRGASGKDYTVLAVVGGGTIVDTLKPHHNSVHARFAEFSDIADDHAFPHRFAVLDDRAKSLSEPNYNLLTKVCRVAPWSGRAAWMPTLAA